MNGSNLAACFCSATKVLFHFYAWKRQVFKCPSWSIEKIHVLPSPSLKTNTVLRLTLYRAVFNSIFQKIIEFFILITIVQDPTVPFLIIDIPYTSHATSTIRLYDFVIDCFVRVKRAYNYVDGV